MELLLLSQFNFASRLPTFFELVAERSLSDTLRDAFNFALRGATERYPARLAAVAQWDDEVYSALRLVLEWLHLHYAGASFSEAIFGLVRSTNIPGRQGDERPPDVTLDAIGASAAGAGTDLELRPLTPRGAAAAAVVAAVWPYLRRRLQRWRQALADDAPGAVAQREASERRRPWLRAVHRAVVALQPLLHALCEAGAVACSVAYLAGKTPHATPELWALGHVVRRATPMDRRELQASPAGVRVVTSARLLLSAMIVGFRFLDWWNAGGTDGASRQQAATTAPPPAPADPAPTAAPAGEVEGGRCPVCGNPTVNPAANTASGYVCCYPCLASHVREHGTCPVSGVRTTALQVRRLYES